MKINRQKPKKNCVFLFFNDRITPTPSADSSSSALTFYSPVNGGNKNLWYKNLFPSNFNFLVVIKDQEVTLQ